MAGKIRTELRPRLAVKPLPATLVRAQAGGELVHAFGGSARDVEIAQTGLAKQLISRIVVYGVNPATGLFEGERVAYELDHTSGDQTVAVEDDDSRSMIERLDEGLGEAVKRTVARFTRRQLVAAIRFHLAPEIAADPQRKAAVYAELGLTEASPIDPSPDYDVLDILDITPGKDRGQRLRISRGRKR